MNCNFKMKMESTFNKRSQNIDQLHFEMKLKQTKKQQSKNIYRKTIVASNHRTNTNDS